MLRVILLVLALCGAARMRWLLVLSIVLAAGPARADGFSAFGLGSAIAENEPGWGLRVEHRGDLTDREGGALVGLRFGLDTWDAGRHWGFAMPIGMYAGGQAKSMRTTIGGGLGLWTFEKSSGSELHFGVSPFASASLEGSAGKLHISLDGRLSRQVIRSADDFNVYSVMLMVGRRSRR